MSDAGIPDPFVDGYAEEVGLGLADRETEGVIAAADYDRVARVEVFYQIVFAD